MEPKKRRFPLMLVLCIIWLLLIFGGYYYVHKPLSPENLLPAIQASKDLILILMVILLFAGIGRKVFSAERIPVIGRITLNFSLGAGLFSIFWFIVGLVGGYYLWLAWGVLFLGLILFFKDWKLWINDILSLRKEIFVGSKFEKFLLFLIFLLLLIQLFIVLSPPVKYDALTYHLHLPRLYEKAHAFVFVPENPYWGHPQLVEILFTFLYIISGARCAALLSWVVGCFVLFGISGMATNWVNEIFPQFVTRKIALVSPIILLAGSTFRNMFSWAYTDLFSALFGVCILLVFIKFIDINDTKYLYLSGILAGFAIGTKLTAVLILLPLGIWLLPGLFRGKMRFTTMLIWAGFFIMTAFAWFLCDYIFTGSPIYPYFIPTEWVDSYRQNAASSSPMNNSLLKNLLIPLTLTWLGTDNGPGFGADIGPLIVLFLPFSLLKFRKNQTFQILGLCLIVWWASMCFGGMIFEHLQRARYYFVFLPCAAILSAWGWFSLQKVKSAGIHLGIIMNSMLVLVMLLVTFQDLTSSQFLNGALYLSGNISEQEYLEESLGLYAPAMQELKELPEESQVLMLWEGRALYAPDNVTPDPWIDTFRVSLHKNQNPQELVKTWKKAGYSHILIYLSGVEFLREENYPGLQEAWKEDWQAFDEMLATLPEPQMIGTGYALYDLRE